MTDKKVFSLILLPMLALTLILGLLVLTSPIRASAGANAPAQTGLSAWNPLRTALVTTPGINGLLPVASAPAAPDAVCTPDTTPMISYWPLDETSGTAFTDVVDGNHGACSDPHCPTPATGKVGGAQQFATSQLDGIVITESPGNELTWANGDSFSFEMWVNFTEACGTEAVPNKAFIGRWRNIVGDAQWWVGCAPGGFPAFSLRDDQTGGPPGVVQITDDVAINDGAWHHVVAVRDAGTDTNRLYVDGVEVTNGAASYNGGFASTGVISLGYYANSYYFDGTLDEVAVYDKALSAAEIANHYNAGAGQSYCDYAPVALDQTVTTDEGVAVPITLEATDADDASLTFSVVDPPLHGDLSGTPPDLTYTPDVGYFGSDSFTFKANDGIADSNVATVSITINMVNSPPTITSDPGDQNNAENADVSLDFEATDPDAGQTLSWSATGLPSGLSIDPGSGMISGTIDYTAAAGSPYDTVVTVEDNGDPVKSDTYNFAWTVTNTNRAPSAIADSYNVDENHPLNVAAPGVLDNDSDPDNDDLTAQLVSGPSHGTLTLNPSGSFDYIPEENYNGTDSFTYKANDGTADSNVVTVTINITAVNDAPVADDQAVTTNEDVAVDITLTATDVDGDTLTYSVVDGPLHGVLSGSGANLTYTPDTGFSGTDSFTFKVNDGKVDSNIATVTITVEPYTGPTLLFLPMAVKANE